MVMYSYYDYEHETGQWWWWSRSPPPGQWQQVQGDPPDGGRYPICITTPDCFNYILGNPQARKPLELAKANTVIQIKDMEDWKSNWERAAPFKLLVLEFYQKNSSSCDAMKKPFEKLARQYGDKAEFYTLDVNNFESLARLCGVEGAYPTFLLFKNGKQVDKIVGVKEDDLKKSIQQALTNK